MQQHTLALEQTPSATHDRFASLSPAAQQAVLELMASLIVELYRATREVNDEHLVERN